MDRLLWGFKPHSIQFCAAWAKQKRIVDRLLWGFKPHFVKFFSRLSWAEKDSGSTLVRMQTSLYSICSVLTEQNKMVDRLRWGFKPHSVQFFSAWAEQKKIVDRRLRGFKPHSVQFCYQIVYMSWAVKYSGSTLVIIQTSLFSICAAWAKPKRIVDHHLWGFKPHFVKFCSCLSWAEKDSGSTLVRIQTSLYLTLLYLSWAEKDSGFKPQSIKVCST